MKITFTLLIIIICVISAYAQNSPANGNVNINRPVVILSDTARYQIIKLDYTNAIVKLDRFTGKTYVCDYNRRKWQLLEVKGGLPAVATSTAPKYQIYSEGEYFTFR